MAHAERTSKRSRESVRTKEEQLRLRHVIDTIPALVWSNLPDGSNEFLSKSWHEYTGLSPDVAHGWGWQAAFHPEDLPPLMEKWRELLISGQHGEIEARLRRSDGVYRWFLIRVEPCCDETGKIRRWYGTSTDIEDRKLAEEQLRRGEAFLVEGQRLSRTGTFSWRLETGEIRWSEELYRIFDFARDQAVTLELIAGRVHPDDLPMMGEMVDHAMRGDDQFEYEHRIIMPDGSTKYIHLIGHAVRDAEGHLEYFGAAHDITQRRIAEKALEASERNLSMIINTMPMLAWSARPDGSIDFLNQRWLDYTGLSPKQALDWRWSVAIHPDDLGHLVDYWQSIMVTGEPGEIEARLRRFDGEYRWFLIRANALRDGSGNIVKWYGTNTDIDDRKKVEEALRTSEFNARMIVDGIPGLVARVAPAGEVEVVNRPLLEYFGKDLEEVRNWAITDAIHPDDLPLALATFAKLPTGNPFDVEHRLRRFDGVYRWFQSRGLPLRGPEGRIVNWYVLLTDIEDRKKAQEALRSNERNLSLIINTMPTLAWSARPDGSAEFLNQHYLDYVGLPLEQLQGWGWTAAVHPEDLNALSSAWESIMAAGKQGETEARLRRFDGEFRWFLFRTTPVRDESGQIVKWYGTNTDIDDRKRAEEALQLNERNLSLMISAIPAFIQVSRADGTVVSVSQSALDYHGVSMADVQREDFRSRFYHPDDRKRIREKREEALKRPVPFEYEQRALGKDGAYRWFLVRYNPLLDDQGRIDRWCAAAFDIEDRKRAEAEVKESYLRLAEAQQLSKTGSFITDLVEDEHNWSEETYRIFEFHPQNKITVQMIRNGIHPEDLPSFDSMIARAMTGKDIDFSFRFVTSRGAVKHIRGMARVIEHSVGRPLFIGALQDVTESKVAEEALNLARSELARVSRVTTLNALTASIAHEISQPLSGIITNASTCLRMLSADPPDVDGACETARRTIRDGNRASDVVGRLRMLYGKKESTLEPMDLNEAAREVISLSLSDLQRNRVILRHELPDDLPLVTGDRTQIQQVILNLLRNALDAMRTVDDRPKELFIKTQREEGNRLRLSVKDVGVGFQPQAADKLFEAFYTTKNDGMGIGLHVSRSIIEAHHGRLWATTNDGPGATFSFAIPCSLSDADTRADRADNATIQR